MRPKADLNWIIKEAIKKAKHYKAEDPSINVHSEAHDIVKEMMSSYDFTYDPYQVDDLLRTKLASRIEALRQIVATKKAAKLDGHVVDTFTAARLLESYKTLDGAGRRRFASMPVHKMVTASDNEKVSAVTAVSERLFDLDSEYQKLVKLISTDGDGHVKSLVNDLDDCISGIESDLDQLHDYYISK